MRCRWTALGPLGNLETVVAHAEQMLTLGSTNVDVENSRFPRKMVYKWWDIHSYVSLEEGNIENSRLESLTYVATMLPPSGLKTAFASSCWYVFLGSSVYFMYFDVSYCLLLNYCLESTLSFIPVHEIFQYTCASKHPLGLFPQSFWYIVAISTG